MAPKEEIVDVAAETHAIVPVRPHATDVPAEYAVEDVIHQVEKIKDLMSRAMDENQHYGVIPGTDKPTLLKPGAEKLCFLFKLAPKYRIDVNRLEGQHREYEITCDLYHIPTGAWCGSGVGVCSTMESKYRWRKAERTCPQCGVAAIIKGKKEYGGGWLCFKKKDGCGAKFEDGDESIESQEVGRKENADLADQYNTVKKMAKKRALSDAILTATAASDIFAQDLEDLPQEQIVEPDRAKGKPDTPTATLATPTQRKGLWDKCAQKATEHGVSGKFVWGQLMAALGRKTKTDLLKADVDKAVKWIAQYDPAAVDEKDGAPF